MRALLIQIGVKHEIFKIALFTGLRALLIQIGVKLNTRIGFTRISLRALGLRYNRDTEEKA